MQAALVVADRNQSLQITGNGDVLEPHDGIIAIGSGRRAIRCWCPCCCVHAAWWRASMLAGSWLARQTLCHAGLGVAAAGACAVAAPADVTWPCAVPGCSPYALAAARALIDQPNMDALAVGALYARPWAVCGSVSAARMIHIVPLPTYRPLGSLCICPLLPTAARKAMQIASDACIYTNDNYTALHIDGEGKIAEIDIKAAGSSSSGGKE